MHPIRTYRLWKKWRKDWEKICNRCGKCCYIRSVTKNGVVVHYDMPCEYFDTETKLCTVYEDRFKVCDHCGKVTLSTALFNPSLPKDCPYVQIFRYGNETEEEEKDEK